MNRRPQLQKSSEYRPETENPDLTLRRETYVDSWGATARLHCEAHLLIEKGVPAKSQSSTSWLSVSCSLVLIPAYNLHIIITSKMRNPRNLFVALALCDLLKGINRRTPRSW